MNQARRLAFADLREVAASLGANAVIGIDLDYEIIARRGSMLLVSITGTAVTVAPETEQNAALHAIERSARHRAARCNADAERRQREDRSKHAPSNWPRRTRRAATPIDTVAERHVSTHVAEKQQIPAVAPALHGIPPPTPGTRHLRSTEQRITQVRQNADSAPRAPRRTSRRTRRAYRPRKYGSSHFGTHRAYRPRNPDPPLAEGLHADGKPASGHARVSIRRCRSEPERRRSPNRGDQRALWQARHGRRNNNGAWLHANIHR